MTPADRIAYLNALATSLYAFSNLPATITADNTNAVNAAIKANLLKATELTKNIN